MSGGAEYCVYCHKHVAAVAANQVGSGFSASGARPPAYAHPECPHPAGSNSSSQPRRVKARR